MNINNIYIYMDMKRIKMIIIIKNDYVTTWIQVSSYSVMAKLYNMVWNLVQINYDIVNLTMKACFLSRNRQTECFMGCLHIINVVVMYHIVCEHITYVYSCMYEWISPVYSLKYDIFSPLIVILLPPPKKKKSCYYKL